MLLYLTILVLMSSMYHKYRKGKIYMTHVTEYIKTPTNQQDNNPIDNWEKDMKKQFPKEKI